jgi:lysophospholipase L1-like esterase
VLLVRVIDHNLKDARIEAFNHRVQAMAEDRVETPANPANPDRINIVDHHAALSYLIDLNDKIHPNATGYEKMAGAWFKAIRSECKPPTGGCIATVAETAEVR